ncbi:MAG TPA: helix-turn-helix domain-containing protein [Elusimicrobiales bacterium]|nr:helix-turn-helix domain-containing protein [Elusimicrobiales bacterium]HOL63475.1 helix-turn-helix domain-containing protein [Elusimicrobiales bacterium]HPO95599.1 helix-turn-helix domain-containing protein [Elusimicrobiales bacterium]
MEKYLSVPEFAEKLGITRIAVFKKIKKGILPAIKIGKNWVIEERLTKEYFNLKSERKNKKTTKHAQKPFNTETSEYKKRTESNKEIENMGWD